MTVAVLREEVSGGAWERRDSSDFELQWFGGTTGAGGQHRNKTECAARLRHLPTNTVKTAQTRSRENSYKLAMAALVEELDRMSRLAAGAAVNSERRQQLGSGERSDKRRTWRFQDGIVRDHVTGRSAPIDLVLGGRFDLLWV